MASSVRLRTGQRVSGAELIDLLAGHVSGIAAVRGVTVEYKEGARACAWPSERRIKTRPIRSPKTYFEALHEIGHVLAKGRSVGGRFAQEGRAWEWALEESIILPTDGVKSFIMRCVGNYHESYIRREQRGQKVVWPPLAHVVWNYLHGRF